MDIRSKFEQVRNDVAQNLNNYLFFSISFCTYIYRKRSLRRQVSSLNH